MKRRYYKLSVYRKESILKNEKVYNRWILREVYYYNNYKDAIAGIRFSNLYSINFKGVLRMTFKRGNYKYINDKKI